MFYIRILTQATGVTIIVPKTKVDWSHNSKKSQSS